MKEFISKFKLATLTLSDDLRCLALNKVLKGPAYVWAKTKIKPKITTGDWKGIKRDLLERFGPSDPELTYRENINKMKFEEENSTLMSYIESFVSNYKQAFKGSSEIDVIKAIRINLPDKIIRGLNLLDYRWSDYISIDELITLIRRYETKIMPFEKKQADNKILTVDKFLSALEEFKEPIKTEVSRELASKDTNLALNAMTHEKHPYKSNQSEERYVKQYKRKSTDLNDGRSDDVRPRTHNESARARAGYEERFGKIPGKCWTCAGEHFNRHCPMIRKDLN